MCLPVSDTEHIGAPNNQQPTWYCAMQVPGLGDQPQASASKRSPAKAPPAKASPARNVPTKASKPQPAARPAAQAQHAPAMQHQYSDASAFGGALDATFPDSPSHFRPGMVFGISTEGDLHLSQQQQQHKSPRHEQHHRQHSGEHAAVDPYGQQHEQHEQPEVDWSRLDREQQLQLLKEQRAAEYRAELEQQIQERSTAKQQQLAARKQQELQEQQQMALHPPPWDPAARAQRRGGGGDPMRDTCGNPTGDIRGLRPMHMQPDQAGMDAGGALMHAEDYAVMHVAPHELQRASAQYTGMAYPGTVSPGMLRTSSEGASMYAATGPEPLSASPSSAQLGMGPTGGSGRKASFMSAMAELRPGPSDQQRRVQEQQRQQLKKDLEEQVGAGGAAHGPACMMGLLWHVM